MFNYYYLFTWLSQIFVASFGVLYCSARLSCSAAGGILVPPPGIKSMCPAFLTTGSPGKSQMKYFKKKNSQRGPTVHQAVLTTLHSSSVIWFLYIH